MADYPDWTRLFQLAGTKITIPINIEGSDVELSVSIDAITADLEVTITAAEVTLDINFLDQSVAVFDANQWFALQAQQVFLQGSGSVADNAQTALVSRTVPTGRTFFITGIAYSCQPPSAGPLAMEGALVVGGSIVAGLGSYRGLGVAFDTPVRATAGQAVSVNVGQWGAGAANACTASLWGYDRID